jgi:hypothetical protein
MLLRVGSKADFCEYGDKTSGIGKGMTLLASEGLMYGVSDTSLSPGGWCTLVCRCNI